MILNKENTIDISLIKTGDVLLVSGVSFLAEAIKKFEDCPYNHAAMFVWIGGELYVWEAIEKGIETTLFSDYTNDKSIGLLVMKPKFTMPSDNDLISFVQPYVGHSNYDLWDLFILQPIRFLTHGWLGGKPNPLTRKFTCGMFVIFIVNHFFPKYFPLWHQGAPSDLFATSQGKDAIYDAFVYFHYDVF